MQMYTWLVVYLPSEKYAFVSWDDDIPDKWKNVPIHQPYIYIYINMCIYYIIYLLSQYLLYYKNIYIYIWKPMGTYLQYIYMYCIMCFVYIYIYMGC